MILFVPVAEQVVLVVVSQLKAGVWQ